MTTIRIMTYNLHGCRDTTALHQTVENNGADLIALQNVTNLPLCHNLAARYGYSLYVCEQSCLSTCLVLLAQHPVKIFNTYNLHNDAYGMYSEHVLGDCRFNLFNIVLKGELFKGFEPLRALLNLDVFQPTQLQLPTLVVGDFFESLWISSYLPFQKKFTRLSPTLLRGTYPSFFPIYSRDRIYASDQVKLQSVVIDRSNNARSASLHLPIIVDVEIQENRTSVSDRCEIQSPMNIAPSSL